MTSPANENAALARRYLADVVAAGDREASRAFLAEGARIHDLVFGDRHRGWPGADDDLAIDVHDVLATRDRAAVRASVRVGAARADGFEVAGAWFYRIESGRIAELWCLPDGLGLLRGTGAIPRSPDVTESDYHL